jgi:hypothetical protein
MRDILAADDDLPFGRHFQPGDHAQAGGLAAARGAEQRHQIGRRDDEGHIVHGDDRAIGLGDIAEFDGGGSFAIVFALKYQPAGGAVIGWAALRRPILRSPTKALISQVDRHAHDHDQRGGIGDGQAMLAGIDPADDVDRRHVVFGRDEEDHGADGRHGAHEGVDQTGDDRRLEQRQHDPAHGGEGMRAQRDRGFIEALVDLAERGDAGAHAHRHVAEDEADDEDQRRAGDLDRRHVEGEDVADADHRAGNGEGQQRAELEGALAGKVLPRQQIGGEDADGGGERRGDQRDLHRGEERGPGAAREDQAMRPLSMLKAVM